MKQGQFLIEFLDSSSSETLYLVRAINGQVVSICRGIDSFQEFLKENDSKIHNAKSNEAS